VVRVHFSFGLARHTGQRTDNIRFCVSRSTGGLVVLMIATVGYSPNFYSRSTLCLPDAKCVNRPMWMDPRLNVDLAHQRQPMFIVVFFARSERDNGCTTLGWKIRAQHDMAPSPSNTEQIYRRLEPTMR
jgi:hypothetical protein